MSIDPQYVFSHHLKALDLSREIHRIYVDFSYHKSSGEADTVGDWISRVLSCSADLFDWSARLPRMLQMDAVQETAKVTPRCFPSLVMLHGYWCALVIHLHSMVICLTLPECPRLSEVRSQSHEHCTRAVEHLIGMIGRIRGTTLKQLGWPFAWSLWTALRYLLACQVHSGMQILDGWDTLLRCLQAAAKYWQIGMKYWRMLNRAMSELQQSMSSPLLGPPRFLSSVVDLRISTADLEDRFRVDPVLHQRDDVPEHSNNTDATRFGCEYPDPRAVEDSLATEMSMYSTSIFQDPDTWYNMPLYATSAYQQSSQSTFDSTAAYP
ncbi:C6 transcription factor [Paraphaeosphaeria sporulosa]